MVTLRAGRAGLVHVSRLAPAHRDVAACVAQDIAQRVQNGVVLVGANLDGEVTMTEIFLKRVVGKSFHRG